jgi:hypothetical protein
MWNSISSVSLGKAFYETIEDAITTAINDDYKVAQGNNDILKDIIHMIEHS